MTTRTFRWRMQDRTFAGCSSLELRVNYADLTACEITFDRNRIFYNEFGDASTTLILFGPTTISMVANPITDPVGTGRKLFDLTLPSNVYKHLNSQELKLVVPSATSAAEPAKLVLVEDRETGPVVTQVAVLT